MERISIEESLEYLDDIQNLANDLDEPSISIGLRVPENILRALRLKAKADEKSINRS